MGAFNDTMWQMNSYNHQQAFNSQFQNDLNDKASKGVGTAGLTTGIIGTALGVLNNGGLGGILGGLGGLGGNANSALANENTNLKAQLAQVTAEKYADQVGKETYMQSLADNRALRDELYAFIKPLSDEAAQNRVNIATLAAEQKCCCEKQELREQNLIGRINETALVLGGKVENLASQTKGAYDTLSSNLACVAARVDGITKTIVPASAICPTPMPLFNSWTPPTGSSNGQSGNGPLAASNVVGK